MTPAREARSRSWDALIPIAERFDLPAPVAEIGELGQGNVNDTFLVTLTTPGSPSVVLQRLNTAVFSRPRRVMANIRRFSEHVDRRLQAGCEALGERRWEVPRVYRARGSSDPWVELDGDFWRAISFIESSRCFETIRDDRHAREVGYALGMFHALISDLPVADLVDTLEGFHIAPGYLAAYDRIRDATTLPASEEVDRCMRFIEARRGLVAVLEEAKDNGRLPLRPIHGDPKINNILMDVHGREAIGLIDLDTVKPGLVHYDIGDCLRSACNRLGEETPDWRSVRFDVDLAASVLEGYGSVARSFLDDDDYAYLFDAIRLIAFELGLRFFTDHLAGDTYFKTRHPHHNLERALVQFRLTESIEAQETEIRAGIAAMR